MNIETGDFRYTLRVSSRARRVRLAVKPYQGLEVVIPKRFPRKQIAPILQQHHAWITNQLEKHRKSLQPADRPGVIRLALTDQRLSVDYRESNRPALTERDNHIQIECSGKQQAIALLRDWVRHEAKRILPDRLRNLADRTGLDYRKCIVRSQKSRWGSCSSSGTISINDQLLFLPTRHVDYLMLHELCHTRHLNHSAAFWTLVASFEPDYRMLEKRLNADRESVPGWFMQSLYR